MLEKEYTTVRVLVPLSLSLIILIHLRGSTIADTDLWGYMTFGRLFWDSGTFLFSDIYTYLPTHDRWIYHEWLTGVVLYPIYKFAGGIGLVVLRDMLAFATLGFLYLSARIRNSSCTSAFFWLLLVSVLLHIGFGSVLRAQDFTYFFTAIELYILERSRQKGLWLLLLIFVPMQIVWCNLHGGFLAGLAIMAIYCVGEAFSRRQWWPYLAGLILSGLSTLINPYGVDYWTYLYYALTLPRSDITEWASIFTAYKRNYIPIQEVMYYTVLAITALRIIVWACRRDITPILLLSVTFLLGIMHIRHQVFFLLLVAVYLPEPSQRYIKDLQTQLASVWIWLKERAPVVRVDSRRLAAFFTAVLIVILFVIIVTSSFSLKIPIQEKGNILYYPTGALEYIKRNYSSGNILTEFMWGEYLIWNLGPHMKVALDGRYETVYQDRVSNEYFDFMNGKANGFLDDYAHDLVLLKPDSPPVVFLRSSPDWKVAYRDMDSIMFSKVR